MNIFSFDVDWAPDPVIADVIEILDSFGVQGTFFATHDSPLLRKVAAEGNHEVGIHPNFNPLLSGNGGNFQTTIDTLLSIYPSAIGLRSHSLAHSCPILIYCLEKGIKYDSNVYMPFVNDIRPFDYFGLLRIPYNWEDDGQWVSKRTFEDAGLPLKNELNIFSFHPIHVYLNTSDQEMYDTFKKYYQIPEQLLLNRNSKVAGTRDMLIQLLDECRKEKLETATLKQFYETNKI